MPGPRCVTVIVPVRNEARHLPDQLDALAAQTYEGDWELVVVDNGSRDGSGDIARSYAGRVPALRVVEEPRPGINRARNRGLAEARGDVVAYCDADDVATPGWLQGLVDALGTGDIVAGPLDFETLNEPLHKSWRIAIPWTAKRDEGGRYFHVPGGNVAMPTALARELGWDDAYTFGASDGEFFWRAQLQGLTIAEAPAAVMRLRYPESLWELASQFYRYGLGEPLFYRRERDQGMSRPSPRDGVRAWGRLARDLRRAVRSPQRRGMWVRNASYRAGRLVGSIRHRVLYL